MKEIKSDKYIVYVYGNPEEAGNQKPLLKLCKCGKDGKIKEELGKYDLWEQNKLSFDIITTSRQAVDYYKSKTD